MKILIIPSWYPEKSGDISGSFFREQAIALAKHGHQVGVIYPQLRSLRAWKSAFAGPYGIVEELDNGMPTFRSYGIAWFPRIPYANTMLVIRHGLELYQRYIARHGKPDLIHAHSMLNGGVLARALSARHGIPYVVTEHSTAYARGLVRAWQIRLARKVASNAARRFAVSSPFCALLEQGLGTSEWRWEAMPNIVEKKFIEMPLARPTRASSEFVFLNVALLTAKKGVHHLIAAFARAFGDERSVALKIGGDGVERPRLEALAVKLGVADRVHFLGALTREQVADQMASADAFVLSSQYETFGVVVIEALALGKPVIATRCGGPESIVREEDGLLVPSADVPALASAMQSLRANHAQYHAQEIRAACIARFSEAAIVGRLGQVYADVLVEQSLKH